MTRDRSDRDKLRSERAAQFLSSIPHHLTGTDRGGILSAGESAAARIRA